MLVSNAVGHATSAPVHLTVLSSEVDVTQPTDSITEFGNAASAGDPNVPSTIPADAIQNTGLTYINVGHGPSAGAGFPPFRGPVGIVVTPSFGPTILNGIRFYTGTGDPSNDPADFALDGSNDGGNTFTPILADRPLSLPSDRASGNAINPLTDPLQEITFANTNVYTSYRVTFNQVKDNLGTDSTATSMQIGEIEFLGVAPAPTISFDNSVAGQITININGTQPGTLQVTSNLQGKATVWTAIGTVNGSITVSTSPSDPPTFFRVSIP
jgi:hypothetical protein